MQIQLKQQHIEAAIRDFVAKAGITFAIDEINFTAGRGKDGLTAAIDLEDPFSTMLDNVMDSSADQPAPTQHKPASKQAVLEAPEAKKVEPAPEQESEAQDSQATTQAPPFSLEEEAEAPVAEKPAPAPKKEKASLFS